MGRFLKWLLGIVALLVVLLVVAVIVLPMVIDPNDYKAEIVQSVEEKTGRSLAIGQDLKLSVFPWLGVETGGVRLGNARGFGDDAFAEVGQLGLKVKLVPLLSKRLEVDTLVLEGLRLNLQRDKQGRSNWDDLAADKGREASHADDGDTAPVSLSVQGIQIEDARISWDDRQSGEKVVVEGVNLVTGSLAPGADVPVRGGLSLVSEQPRMTLKVALNATASADEALQRLALSGLELVLDASGEGLPADGAHVELSTDLVVDSVADTLSMKALKVSGPAVEASGELSVTNLQTAPAVQGRLVLGETSPKALAAMFGRRLETADPDALTRVSGEFTLAHKDGATRIEPLKLRLDDSSLDGYLHVLDGKGPTLRTRLTLDRIDLDRYMAPAGAGGAGQDDTAAAGSGGDPLAGLRTLDLEGDFSVGELVVAKATLSKLQARVTAKKGLVRVDPATADLYAGKYAGTIELDARTATAKTLLRTRLSGVQVGPLLADIAGQERLTGVGNITTDLRTVGISEQEVRRSLNGTASFAFRDGAIKGVNIPALIRKAGAALGAGSGGPTDSANQTDFSELSASLTANNGVISNRDLSAKSPLLRIGGKGTVDLPKDSIDYLLTTELTSSLEGQGGKGADQLNGVPIPVRVKGHLQDPSYTPDLAEVLKSGAVKKAQDALKGGLKDGLKDGLKGGNIRDQLKQTLDGGGLKGLFGR